MHEPFRLTIRLRSPVIFSGQHLPTLDALCVAARFRQTDNLTEMMEIPLVRMDEVFHGSTPILQQPTGRIPVCQAHKMYRALRREDLDVDGVAWANGSPIDPSRDKRYQSIGSDYPTFRTARSSVLNKSRDQRLPEEPCLALVYDGYGDGEACADLIRDMLPGIGKRADRGYGAIKSVSDPEKIADDRSLTRANGDPARPIPVTLWERLGHTRTGRLVEMATFVPPYSHSKPGLCVLPSKIEYAPVTDAA